MSAGPLPGGGRSTRRPLLATLAAALALAACADSTQKPGISYQTGPGDVRPLYGYKVGEPYRIDGVWYYPSEDYSYRETGVASFYGGERSGVNFHGRLTANGEVYDMNALTAAHTTLPMPSLVRVTNLENGRQLVLRVNDRGPFIPGRIIDVSRRSAQLLGFEGSGTALVRVEILGDESRQLKVALLNTGVIPASLVAAAAAPRQPVATASLQPLPGVREAVPAAQPVPLPPPSVSVAAAPPTTPDRTLAHPAPPIVPVAERVELRPIEPVTAQPLPPLATRPADLRSQTQQAWRQPQANTRPGTALAALPPPPEPAPAPPRLRPPPPLPNEVAALPPEQHARLTPVVRQEAVRPSTIFVQAGAFANYQKMQQVTQRLARYGQTHVQPIKFGQQQLWRVRVGPVRNVETADRLLAQVATVVPEATIVVAQ